MISVFKSSHKALGRCSLQLLDEGIAMAHCIVQKPSSLQLQQCHYLPLAHKSETLDTLAQCLKDNQLKKVPCTWVLHPSQYRLLMVEKPNVPDKELNAAARWLIKDFIDFPLKEASIDTFLSPSMGPKKMLYVVVVRNHWLEEQSALIQQAGFTLDTIGIAELVIGNVMSRCVAQDSCNAFLKLTSQEAQFFVYKQNTFYMTRQLDKALPASTAQDQSDEMFVQWLDELSLEVQRSLDYYERQFRQLLPANLFVLADTANNALQTKILSKLSDDCAMLVSPLDLTQCTGFSISENLTKLALCVDVIGGAIVDDEL